MRSSKELFEKMQTVMDMTQQILRNPKLTAEVQIADINTLCWGLVDLAMRFRQAVDEELGDTEGGGGP